MYILKVKNEVEEKEKKYNEKKIEFTVTKANLFDKLIVVNKIENDFYKYCNLYIHKDWCELILEVDPVSYTLLGEHEGKKISFGVNNKIYLLDYEDTKNYTIFNTDHILIKDILSGDYVFDRHIQSSNNINRLLRSLEEDKCLRTTSKKYNICCNHCRKETNWESFLGFYLSKLLTLNQINDNWSIPLTSSFSFFCPECLNSYYINSLCCNRLTLKSDISTYKIFNTNEDEIEEKELCIRCVLNKYRKCSECNTLIDTNQIKSYEGREVCINCMNKKNVCHNCGTAIKEKAYKLYGNKCCHICFPYLIKRSNVINSYNFKTKPIFFGEKTPLHFGFEFEMEINNVDREVMGESILYHCNKNENKEYCQYFYSKHDGSLKNHGDGGIEIVSYPFTYKFIMNNLYIFEQLFDYKQNNCYSFESDNCGFHIHLSKKAFSNKQLFNFLKLIYENKKFTIKISERTNTDKVDQFCFFNILDYYSLEQLAETKSMEISHRHAAINLCNKDTVELRIFRGTLEKNRFIKNIQYCMSLFEFSNICEIESCSLKEYLSWLKANEEKYNILYSFITNEYMFV